MRRIFLWINLVAASVVALLIFLQAYLITAYVAGAGESALDAHGFVGFAVIHLLEIIVFLTAFGAWPRQWRWIGTTFLFALVGTIQVFLAPTDDSDASGWLHGLHGLLALVVLVWAAVIAHRAMRDLGLRRGRDDAASAGTVPPPPLP
jgi:hypothetical protein